MSDTFTEDGARRLADRIDRYWRAQGYEPTVRVEKVEDVRYRVMKGPVSDLWAVRSDIGRTILVNGIPEWQRS